MDMTQTFNSSDNFLQILAWVFVLPDTQPPPWRYIRIFGLPSLNILTFVSKIVVSRKYFLEIVFGFVSSSTFLYISILYLIDIFFKPPNIMIS